MCPVIRVLIADDHPVIREGIAALINLVDDMNVVAEAKNGAEAVELYRQHQPDVIITDLQMPIMDGVEVTKTLCSEFSRARVIVITSHDGDEDIYRSIQAGAVGYILKDASRDEILKTIRTVYNGKTVFSPEVGEKLAGRIHRAELTAREVEVMNQIAAGKSNMEIGSVLFISEGTVKAHVNSILSKLGVSDRTQAVVCAIQRGIVHLDKVTEQGNIE